MSSTHIVASEIILSGMARSTLSKQLVQWRKQRGLTQVELAKMLGISQRMVAYYEGYAQKLPANLLPSLSKALGVKVEDILGADSPPIQAVEKKLNNRLLKHFEKIEKLSEQDRRMVLRMIDTLAAKNG